MTTRSFLVGSSLAVAMLTAAGCAQVNEAINGRDLECGQVPEDICLRMANHLASLWDPAMAADGGPLVKVTVTPSDCAGLADREPMRCWEVKAGTASSPDGSAGGLGGTYYLRVDGTLIGPRDTVLGSWPVEEAD